EDATNADGRVTFEDIRPGSYTILASPPESAKPLEAKDGSRTAMTPTYYPSVTDPLLARSIVIGDGGPGDFEVRMQTALVHRIGGVVLNEEGKPLPGAEVTISPTPLGVQNVLGLSFRPGGRTSFAMGLRPMLAPSSITPLVVASKDGHFEFPAT